MSQLRSESSFKVRRLIRYAETILAPLHPGGIRRAGEELPILYPPSLPVEVGLLNAAMGLV